MTKRAGRSNDSPTVLVVYLVFLGVFSAVVGTVASVLRFEQGLAEQVALLSSLISAGAYLIGGWSLSGVLLAAAWLLRRQHQAGLTLRRLLAASKAAGGWPTVEAEELPVAASVAQVPVDDSAVEKLDLVLGELKELNATMLLSEDQLKLKRARRQKAAGEDMTMEISKAIAGRQFARAERLLEQLMDLVPDMSHYNEQARTLADARQQSQAKDVEEATDRTEDFMAIGAFAQAREVAEELIDKYPAAPEAIALVDHVRREHNAILAEKRKDLYQEVDRHVLAKRWVQALSAAEKLLAEHPECPEAELVAARMDTLTENARIEQARQLRDSVRELLREKRYQEALAAARELVAEFPETQGAQDLRRQMDTLEQLAGE